MTIKAVEISLVILLTNFTASFTLPNPDYESETLTLHPGQTGSSNSRQSVWYTYDDVSGENYYEFQDNRFSHKSPVRIITKFPSILNQYKAEESKDNAVEDDKTSEVFTTLSNSNNKEPKNNTNSNFYMKRDNNKYDKRFDSTSGGLSATIEPMRKSELKCEEYGRAIGRKVWVLALVGTEPEGVPVSSKKGRCEGLHTPLIVGGTKAQAGEFPHMAALGWSNDGKVQYLCGGSLISERWVLTAAHCTHGHSGSPSVVRLGAHVLSDATLGEVFEIKQIQRHPTYKAPAMYADIALLELKVNVTFKDLIRPTCLYQEYDAAPDQAWATGWGITQIGEDSSDALLKASLNILDTVTCARKYNRSAAVPRGIVPSMMCAGDASGGWQSDTCQGDSGGPLQIIHPTIDCLYQQVGITSFGRLCALHESPGVYTRVSQYLDWIEEIVWPEVA